MSVEADEASTWTPALGRCHRLPGACLKKARVVCGRGLFLALVSRRILVTQKLLAVGQGGEGQVGSRHRKAGRGRGRGVAAGPSGAPAGVRPRLVLSLGSGWKVRGGGEGLCLTISGSHFLRALQLFFFFLPTFKAIRALYGKLVKCREREKKTNI